MLKEWVIPMAKPPFRVGDAVELAYRDGGVRVGTIEAVEYDVVRVLIGGAEGHARLFIADEKLKPAGPYRWRVEME
jgi:hypothetical protein